jgi:glyoxylase-like metal-dependent hydrolase (beta-lactamase superfamily II)
MATAQQPPDLNIPHSDATVEVSIIDTTGHISLPSSLFVQPQLFEYITAPVYSFLIKHRDDTLIFDLGISKDWENGPTSVVERVKPYADKLRIDKDVATILRENGQALKDISAIIWSHAHFDHTGDPTTFPSTTDLVVGPGFKAAFPSAFPTLPDSPVDERAWQNRTLREIDFAASDLRIGQFEAHDYYGDGSLYLLNTPGHFIGHICALARTTANPPTFMFLGGDIAHQAGEFRPTQYLPLPTSISPNPLQRPFTSSQSICPGDIFQALHPNKSATEPFLKPSTAAHAAHLDSEQTLRSIEGLMEFDADESVFSVIAHDMSLFDVVEFYPRGANGWKEKGWGREGRWRFLREFEGGPAKEE